MSPSPFRSTGEARHVLRSLFNRPGYAFTIVLTLALAVAANSAIFGAVRAVLLHPLPIDTPARLVVCWQADRSRSLPVVELSYRMYEEWAAGTSSFAATAAIGSSNWTAVLEGHGDPARIQYAGVTASFFDTMGAHPMAGRTFEANDDVPNAAPVVVLSHGMWTRRYGAAPGVIGSSLTLDGVAHTVVGIMPKEFDFPRGAELWTPVVPIVAASSARWKTDALSDVGVLFALGRLREGVTAAAAAAESDRVFDRRRLEGRLTPESKTIVTPFLDYLLGPVRTALWILFAAVTLLLLIACANVSSLLLSRLALGRRELGVRLALGATRFDLAWRTTLETAVLAVSGAAVGLLLSRWMAAAIVTLAPDDLPGLSNVVIDLPVATFTLGTTVLVAFCCGLGPVRQAAATNLADALAETGRATAARGSRAVRSMLLTFQIALAVILLVAAGLVARSFVTLRSIDLGFNPHGVLTMHVSPRGGTSSANQWFEDLLQQVAAIPGVRTAGAVYLPPLALGAIGEETAVLLEGQSDSSASRRRNPPLNYQVATPGYFEAMRIHLKRGRLFNRHDDGRSQRVAIVGESAAARLWPGQDPLGKRLGMPSFSPGDSATVWRTVVGVVADVHYRGLDDGRFDVYDPALQAASIAGTLVVRSDEDPLAIAAAIQSRIREVDPHAVIDRISTLDAVVSRAMAPWRMTAWIFTLFAAAAFALAMLGLGSLVSLDVTSRRREIAVRLAIGARASHIIRSVVSSAAAWVCSGVAIGLCAALASGRLLQHVLFGVGPFDAPTYAGVLVAVAIVVSCAAYVPARRATRVDPMILLRGE